MPLPDDTRIQVAEVLHWGSVPHTPDHLPETDWGLVDDIEEGLYPEIRQAEEVFGFVSFRSANGKFYRMRVGVYAEEVPEAEAHPDSAGELEELDGQAER